MAQSTETSSPGMIQAAERLLVTHRLATQGRSAVMNDLAMLRGSWRGGASDKFNNAMNAWMDDCNNIITALETMIRMLQDNRHMILKGESNAEDLAVSIPVGPGLDI